MKSRLINDGHELLFDCPGCENSHSIPVDGSRGWKWNGSLDFPTITPSILVYGHDSSPPFKPQPRCHSFVTDGKIQFLPDSGHKLSGQTVELQNCEE